MTIIIKYRNKNNDNKDKKYSVKFNKNIYLLFSIIFLNIKLLKEKKINKEFYRKKCTSCCIKYFSNLFKL